MELIQLTQDYDLKPFDCGDADLNGFLLNDAISFYEKNDFQMLLSEDRDKHTRMMYFDMMRL